VLRHDHDGRIPVQSAGELSKTDITSAAFKADPFAFYARLREEAPVFPVTLRLGRREQRAWLVTRYHDVAALLKNDADFVKNPRNAMTPRQLREAPAANLPGPFKVLQQGLLSIDGADHDRLKALVHKAFTPRTVERMRDHARTVTDEALSAALRRGRADLIEDFALPIPLAIIGRVLGVPDRDHGRFSAWTRALVSIGDRSPLLAVPTILTFMAYMRRLVRQRRAAPRDDLISALVAAQDNDDALSDDEVLSMIFLLLSAGHETTVNLIASGTLALLQHPDQLERLRADPALMKPPSRNSCASWPPSSRAPNGTRRVTWSSRASTFPKANSFSACSPRQTAIPGSSTLRTDWTWAEPTTVISASGWACTTVSGRHWRVSKRRSP
jgi:cytochrome P450 PksS